MSYLCGSERDHLPIYLYYIFCLESRALSVQGTIENRPGLFQESYLLPRRVYLPSHIKRRANENALTLDATKNEVPGNQTGCEVPALGIRFNPRADNYLFLSPT
jgi:hypothetical protein